MLSTQVASRRPDSLWAATFVFVGTAITTFVVLRYLEERDTDDGDAEHQPVIRKKANVRSADDELPSHLVRELQKEERRQAKIPLLARKKVMYDNIPMICPRGVHLCNISKKKADWYMSKGLAEWVQTDDNDNEQPVLQLKFEPSGRSSQDRGETHEYLTSKKENICVGCGANEYHMRHYIVPYAYRSRLPARYKSHMSHDIVLLCPTCHLDCLEKTQERRQELEEVARRVRDPSTTAKKFRVDKHLAQVRSMALALLRWKNKLPHERAKECDLVVREHLGLVDQETELTAEQLQQAIDVDYKIANDNYVPAEELLVESLLEGGEESIMDFVRDWREFFVHVVQPRHLPSGWSVDSPFFSDKVSRKETESATGIVGQ